MKIEIINDGSDFIIRSYSDDGIQVNDELLSESFIISPDMLIRSWPPCHASELDRTDLDPVYNLQPEVILLGTGKSLHFLPSSISHLLEAKQIGFEVMDTFAACRCYNILVSEGRKVAAGLMLEKTGQLASSTDENNQI